jgi:hypothetical protein
MRNVCASIIFALLCCAGCQQQQVTLRSWQNEVDHYILDQANGNPAVLRDLPTPGPWKGFSVLGENDPASSTDVNGVLLGHRSIGSKTYFIYLVGLVKQAQVQDIRLALLNDSPEGLQWQSSGSNGDSMKTYKDFRTAEWKKLFPGRQSGPWSYTGFPGEGDVFKISIAGKRVTATHEASGAQWTLELSQDGPTTAPAVAGSN